MLKLIEMKSEGLDYVVYADGERLHSFNQLSDDWAYTNARNLAFKLLKEKGNAETKIILN